MNQAENRQSFVLLISIDGMANYNLEDPNVKMPNLRGLMKQGATTKALVSVCPTATWAIHSSLVTGTYPRKHGVLGNWVIDRRTGTFGEYFGDRMYRQKDVLKVPTIHDVAKQQGWTTASICWPVTRESISIDYNIPEFYDQKLFEAYSTPSLWNGLREAGLPIEQYGSWSLDRARVHMQDWLSTEVAKFVIQKHKPNLLTLHYLLPDSMQHDYGTCSREAYWALEYIDERIGDLIATLKSEEIWDDTHIFVVSDHGFVDTAMDLYINVLFKNKGWLDPDHSPNTKVIAASNGGIGFVYILEEDESKKKALLAEVYLLLAQTEGINTIFEEEQFPSLGLPAIGEMEHQRPDLVFEAELDCFIRYEIGEEEIVKPSKFKGMHGYLPNHEDLKAIFVAAGPSIQSGIVLPEANLVDVAPTITSLIEGAQLPDADGHCLPIWKSD
jgi:predicted AlkP superfamily pyrophosphatase or phosphodiesterase